MLENIEIKDVATYSNEGQSIEGLNKIIIEEQHNCKATGYLKTNSIKYICYWLMSTCLCFEVKRFGRDDY